MKIEGFREPKSSFLSIEKDLATITNEIMKCDRIKRLLFYTTPDALDRPNLTPEQEQTLFPTNIKTVPKLYVDGSVLNYIIINFDNFIPNATNPEFRDNIIEFDIVCHFDQWQLKDSKLRPYRIAAELDEMFDGRHLSGIGKTEFAGATQIILTDEYAGLCLMYRTVHDGDDEKNMINPAEWESFVEEFNKQYNEHD